MINVIDNKIVSMLSHYFIINEKYYYNITNKYTYVILIYTTVTLSIARTGSKRSRHHCTM